MSERAKATEKDALAELEAARSAAEEALRRRWGGVPEDREPMLQYVIAFECEPSVFEAVKRYIATQRTFRRSFRFYPIEKEKEKTRTWPNRT